MAIMNDILMHGKLCRRLAAKNMSHWTESSLRPLEEVAPQISTTKLIVTAANCPTCIDDGKCPPAPAALKSATKS
jgi:hypothetical protein